MHRPAWVSTVVPMVVLQLARRRRGFGEEASGGMLRTLPWVVAALLCVLLFWVWR